MHKRVLSAAFLLGFGSFLALQAKEPDPSSIVNEWLADQKRLNEFASGAKEFTREMNQAVVDADKTASERLSRKYNLALHTCRGLGAVAGLCLAYGAEMYLGFKFGANLGISTLAYAGLPIVGGWAGGRLRAYSVPKPSLQPDQGGEDFLKDFDSKAAAVIGEIGSKVRDLQALISLNDWSVENLKKAYQLHKELLAIEANRFPQLLQEGHREISLRISDSSQEQRYLSRFNARYATLAGQASGVRLEILSPLIESVASQLNLPKTLPKAHDVEASGNGSSGGGVPNDFSKTVFFDPTQPGLERRYFVSPDCQLKMSQLGAFESSFRARALDE